MIISRFFAVLIALIAAVPASASVQIGSYEGKLANGDACSFEVKSFAFAGGVRHPLNERATIQFQGTEYVLSHSPVVDEAAGTVLFNHDDLRAIIAVPGGATALLLKMDHSEGRDGPSELVLMSHDYRNAANNTRVACTGLTFKQPAAKKKQASHTVQYIDCSDRDPESFDKVIISLRPDSSSGTLFISSGVHTEEPNNSGVLPLTRSAQQDRSAHTAYEANNSVARFRVTLPNGILNRYSDSFTMRLEGAMSDGSFTHAEEFVCFSRLY